MLLHCLTLGLIDYAQALAWQEELVQRRCAGEGEDTLLLLEHPPVFTLGRGANEQYLLAPRGIPVHRVGRGGEVTFHGPGQLVGYPIIDLTRHGRDVHTYLRMLEQIMIAVLAEYELHAQRREGLTGVWVNKGKIASIGIGVRRWISFHGFALNVDPDLAYFDDIVPCGLRGVRMVSMGQLCAQPIDMATVKITVAAQFATAFGYQEIVWLKSFLPQMTIHNPQSAIR